MTRDTPIQMLAQLRSDIADRQDALERDRKAMTEDCIGKVHSREEDVLCSGDTFDLMNVLLSQKPDSLGDVLSLAAAIAEISSQVLVSDDKDVNDAGERIERAAVAMVAFLGREIVPCNAMDAYEVRRCTTITAARFPAVPEQQA